MTESLKIDLRAISVAVISAMLVGLPSSYMTAQEVMTEQRGKQQRVEERQDRMRKRIERMETEQDQVSRDLSDTTTELRVLNERLRRLDDLADSVKRLERRMERDRRAGE